MPQKSHFETLVNKWSRKQQEAQKKLLTKHGDALAWLTQNTRHLALGTIGSVLMLAAPHTLSLPAPHDASAKEAHLKLPKKTFFISDLARVLPPKEVRELSPDEEKQIAEILSRNTGLKVSSELSGIRLNRSYGIIGQEQHLARYPGDTMASHFEGEAEAREFGEQGMAPGLGAWGYFAPSQSQMTQKDVLREKYYIAVQTFLAPGFSEHTGEYIEFFKYRKMLVVNPENGRAMVTIIGDAGPGEFTGKHLGGSPEVMRYLERQDGASRGPVLYFFIDDPEDKVPLGPIEVK